MSIIHGLVAHDTTIVAEYKIDETIDNTAVVQAILEKIPPNNSKLTYAYDRYLFHYISEGGITYLCMADESFGRRTPFIFLENMQSRLLSNYSQSQILDAPPYGLHSFGNMIEELLGYYNTHQETDKLKRVQGEIHQVKDVMSHNIERVLERGERIDILVDRTDNLNQQAFAFKKRSTLLKRTMWWKNTKIVMLITVTCVIIFLFITVFIYGKSSSSKE